MSLKVEIISGLILAAIAVCGTWIYLDVWDLNRRYKKALKKGADELKELRERAFACADKILFYGDIQEDVKRLKDRGVLMDQAIQETLLRFKAIEREVKKMEDRIKAFEEQLKELKKCGTY